MRTHAKPAPVNFGSGGWAKLGPHLTQYGWGRGLPACQVSSWSIQPFGHNTPTSQTGQRSDSIGRTVLQTVAQKQWQCTVMDTCVDKWVACITRERFLANVNSRSLYAVVRPSVCRLSVCNARVPYSGGWNFRQYFYGVRYLDHPLTSTENFTEIVPGEPLRRGS